MMKVYESCFGPQVLREIRREMREAAEKCSDIVPQSEGTFIPHQTINQSIIPIFVWFKNFLDKNRFDEESKTLTFSLKCQNILGEISRLSPSTRSQELPHKIQNDIRNIYELANDVNFDLDQMNNLRNLYSSDVDKKVMGKRKIRIRR